MQEAQLDELRRAAGNAQDARRQLKEKVQSWRRCGLQCSSVLGGASAVPLQERELEEERNRMQETSRGLERQLQQVATQHNLVATQHNLVLTQHNLVATQHNLVAMQYKEPWARCDVRE